MSARVIPINGDKAVTILREMVKEWRTRENGWSPQDTLDVFCEQAIAAGVVTKGDIDQWDDEDEARRARMQRVAWYQG